MSAGIEVAGLLLAIFPVVIAVVNWYGDRVTFRDIKFLAEQLGNHKQMFLNTLAQMLLSVVSPLEAGRLLNDPDAAAWKDVRLNDRILEHLGPQANRILGQIGEIYRTVLVLQEKLTKGTLGASDTSTRARAVRIMKNFVRGSHDKSSIERLKIRIQDFRTLIDDALKLASTHGGLPASLQSLDLVRDCANRLYNALQAGWRCNCNEVHPANMQLEIWPMSSAGSKVVSDSSEFKFCFLFAPDVEVAQSEYWMVAEIAISQQSMISSGGLVASPVSTTVNAVPCATAANASNTSGVDDMVDDLCTHLKGPFSRTHVRRRRLSSVSGSNGCNYNLFLEPDPVTAARTKSSIKLAETFQKPSTMSRKHRMKLALKMAWGVLHVYSTSWLKGGWTKEHVLLLMDDANKPSPYLSHAFRSARRNSQSSTLAPAISDRMEEWVKDATLFALGVFLLEMCHHRSIEDLASPKERPPSGEAPWSCTPFLTANRLAKTVQDEMGMDYAQAVKACLNLECTDTGLAAKLKGSSDFAKKMVNEIIEPLKKAADYYGE